MKYRSRDVYIALRRQFGRGYMDGVGRIDFNSEERETERNDGR